jgi:hypothetical protein
MSASMPQILNFFVAVRFQSAALGIAAAFVALVVACRTYYILPPVAEFRAARIPVSAEERAGGQNVS